MKSSPRSPLLGLGAIAAVAFAGLLWLVFSQALNDDGEWGVRPAFPETIGPSEPEQGEPPAEGADLAIPASKEPGADEISAARSSLDPQRSSLGESAAIETEYRAVLLVQDLATGLPIEGAAVGEVFRGGEAVKARRGEDAAVSGEDGRLEVAAWIPSGPDVAPELRLDVRIVAAGYVEAIASSLSAVPSAGSGDAADSRAILPPRVVSLQRAGALVLDIIGAPAGSAGELAVWFDYSARGRRPDLSLEWPIQPKRGTGEPAVGVEAGAGGSIRVVLEDLTPGSFSVALAIRGRPVAFQQSLALLPGERLQVSLPVKQGEIASGVVLDLETRQPVPGVSLQMKPEIPGLPARIDELPYPAVLTDARGAFSIAGLPLGVIQAVLVTVDGATHPRDVTVVPGNQTRSHELRVRGSAALAGTVSVPEGMSASGVQVLVTTADAAPRVQDRDGRLQVEDGFGPGVFALVDLRTGEFSAEHVPSGRKLVVYAIAPGTSLGIATVSELKRGERRERVQVVLLPRADRLFRVTSTTGEIIGDVRASFLGAWTVGGDAESTASNRRAPARWTARDTIEARHDGLFVASPALGEIERVRIWWGDRARGAFEWPAANVEEVPHFELTPEPRVAFEVTGSDGLAIRGARIVASLQNGGDGQRSRRGPTSTARTDEFGRAYLALPVPADAEGSTACSLRVIADGFVTRSDLEVDLGDALPAEARRVVMERPPRIEWARITGRLAQPNGDLVPGPRFDGLRGGTVRIDEHDFEIRGLRPGRHEIVVHCDRFESLRLPAIRLEPGEHLDMGELTMRFGTRVDVLVKDAKGRPVREAQVQLVRLPDRQSGRTGLPRSVDFPRSSQPVGLFRRANVPRARWRLVVSHPGHEVYREVVSVTGSVKRLSVALKAKS
ncbi:hypothetical protein Poly30_32660 [Planctomycetes bacterium Poly30]|uniref:Nickel uptake substrate-specific transmembrane region n=1 Tax=Saltatorellus ferox TaxID=2528018 RepID=A0A518EUF4_9BACT|nr:hypothetical protein Poly30_32660 [Planctomycetes bacterium Poly30]